MTNKQIDWDIYRNCIHSLNCIGIQDFSAWLYSVKEGLVSLPNGPSYMRKVTRDRWLKIAEQALIDYAAKMALANEEQVVVE